MTGGLLLGLGVLGLLLAGSSRSPSSSSRGQIACSTTPGDAARFAARASLISWVQCADRTQTDVDALARLLRGDRRTADALAIEAAWAARRRVDATPADGLLASEAEEARAIDALTARDVPIADEPPPRRGTVILPTEDDIDRLTSSSSSSAARRREGALAGFDPAEARRLATQVARSLRSGGGYRSALTRFQRAAGITADGLYGPTSRAALRHYGISDPPAALVSRSAPEVYTPPVIETEAVSVSGGLSSLVDDVLTGEVVS